MREAAIKRERRCVISLKAREPVTLTDYIIVAYIHVQLLANCFFIPRIDLDIKHVISFDEGDYHYLIGNGCSKCM